MNDDPHHHEVALELGKEKDPKHIPLLLEILKCGTPQAKRYAASAIRKMLPQHRDPCLQAIPVLVDCANTSERQVRQYCLNALNSLRPPELTPQQLEIIQNIARNDPNEYNQEGAYDLLKRLPNFNPGKRLIAVAPGSRPKAKPKEPAKLSLTLTEEQNQCLEQIKTFLSNREQWEFCLMGYAGTGKSTMCSHLLHHLPKLTFALAATTNKAVRVLKQMALKNGLATPAKTIHSLLNLNVIEEEGQIRLEQVKTPNLRKIDVIIIDECSMINDELMNILQEVPREHRVKIIYMGDPAQLPPVREQGSRSFETPEHVLLKTVIRQKGDNPILNTATLLRQAMEEKNFQLPLMEPENIEKVGLFKAKSETQWQHWIRQYFSQKESLNEADRFRVLTWSNERVHQLNSMIHQHLYPNEEKPFCVGQRIIVLQPIFDMDKQRGPAKLNTDDECEVESIRSCTVQGMKAWRLRLKPLDRDSGSTDVTIISKEHTPLFNEKLNVLKQKALMKRFLWKEFYKLRNQFVRVQHNYAMTVHRSQGSTFQNVFVDVPIICQNSNRLECLKMLYVAMTRAEQAVLFY